MTNVEKILSFAKLSKGWDSYDADPPTIRAISLALYFEAILKNSPKKIIPHVAGGIAFSWDEIYVEIYNDGDVVSVFDKNSDNPLISDEHNLLRLARKIYKYDS